MFRMVFPPIIRSVYNWIYAPDDGWKYHPKHVEQFPDMNKMCNVVSCWIYEYTGILLGVHYILHISRIRVKCIKLPKFQSISTYVCLELNAFCGS
jgi:hypothetical protein